jgi:hypothetical protein
VLGRGFVLGRGGIGPPAFLQRSNVRVDVRSPRDVARRLSQYLCGTRSGILALKSGRDRAFGCANDIASAHARLALTPSRLRTELGTRSWEPEEEPALAYALREALDHPAIVELILYGSQARGGRTGFSDVDAILVMRDEAADDPAALRSLHRHVLAAQRAVLRYQPMQHHGFEVVTPRLLLQAEEALALPAVALSETSSLNGVSVTARFADRHSDGSAFGALSASLRRLHSWPRHPWEAHRHVAMFELLPTLYLQRRGIAVPKWRSFQEARTEFEDDWWPYDAIAHVRQIWPRLRRPMLDCSAVVLRNPWSAVAAWRRLPVPVPAAVRPLLTPGLMEGLRELVQSMTAHSR